MVLLKSTLLDEDWALGKMVIEQTLIELDAAQARYEFFSSEFFDRILSEISRIDAYNKTENYPAALEALGQLAITIEK